MFTIYFWCCHNVCLFVFEKGSFWPRFFLDCCKRYHFYKYFLSYFTNSYEVPQVLQSVIWYPTFFKKLRIYWLDQYTYFTGFVELPISIYPALNRWKTEMRSDLPRYLMFIVGFYKRSVPLFLYVLQFNHDFKNIPIGNMLYWWSGAGVGRYMS